MKRKAYGAGIVAVCVPQRLFFVRDFAEQTEIRDTPEQHRICQDEAKFPCALNGTVEQEAAVISHDTRGTLERAEAMAPATKQSKKHQNKSVSFRAAQAVSSPLALASQLRKWFEDAEKRTAPDWWRDLASTGGAQFLSQMCLRVVMKHVYGPLQMRVQVPRRDAWTYNAIVGDGVKVLHRLAKPTPVAGGNCYEVYIGKRSTQATGIIPFSTDDPLDIFVVYVLRRQRRQPCDVRDDVLLSESGLRGIFVLPRAVLMQHFVDPAVRNEGSIRLGVYHPDAKPRTSRCASRKSELDKYFIDFEKFHNNYSVEAMKNIVQKESVICHAELEKVRQVFDNVMVDAKDKENE
ncbi:unnamed protein product [Amoebophrya sp. A25]|nr:unnamed protein product [Amoebophrya sp. A25]|eukprot:GSA25T00002563001.1